MRMHGLLFFVFLFVHTLALPQEAALPMLTLGADEVHVTFRALDALGRPVTDLTSRDVRLFDNGKQPLRVVSFEHVGNLPIRAGLVFDTSRSMGGEIDSDKTIARLYASQLLRTGTDQALVMGFDFEQKVLQPWTDVTRDLLRGLDAVGRGSSSRIGGTKVYDSVYKACRDEWDERTAAATANFILLFTDGEDNASNAYLSEAVEMCRQRQVTIYVVTRQEKTRDAGQRVLEELAKETGGSLTYAKSEAEAAQALATIRSMVEDRYTVVYKPQAVKRDGKFHKLKISCVQACLEVRAAAGYYATR